MSESIYISVILPLKLEWEPCYCSEHPVHTGDRVKVEFAKKEYIGVANQIGITPDISPEKIKQIISIESDVPPILPQEIELWKKVSEYYMCTIGEVYKAAYPSIKINLEQARAEAKKRVCLKREKAVEAVRSRLEKLIGRLEKKEKDFSKSKEGTKTRLTLSEDIARIKEAIIAGHAALETATSSLKAAQEGQIAHVMSDIAENVSLSAAQTVARNEISDGFKAGKPVLLHGVTGSGKTEIYISLALEALRNRKNVLYLVPEIALSRQLEERLGKHFGERLITFHSGESAASRRNSAEIVRNPDSSVGNYVALCTRSGLFLPHHDLGLIIVDEEHDKSYKQDSPAPRYNGRDTALLLSTINKDCKIILGSATPSLEEIYNTKTGKHKLVCLNERFHGSAPPDVEIIDTRAERKKRGMIGSFSRKLIDNIRQTLQSGEQILILRSRRAWATALQCEVCGELQKCPHCNVSMNLHKGNGRMVCHYCGHSMQHTGRCAKCSGPLISLGTGTQKIEEEAAVLFPQARIARLDADTAQNHKNIIRDFSQGDIDILVGTQMISKGFDFSNLTLVAVISADSLLSADDFRADENTHQLMEQFRGRCGRREKTGRFIIQTSQPEHPLFTEISGTNANVFSDRLLAERQAFGFPPYCRIIEISIRDQHEKRLGKLSGLLAQELKQLNPVGPYTPAVDKIADQFIRKIRICLPKDSRLNRQKELIKEKISTFEKSYKYDGHTIIDVDPS